MSSVSSAVLGLAVLLIGYSVFGAVVLAVTHFRAEAYAEQPQSRWMGLLLLVALVVLQLSHFGLLVLQADAVGSVAYRLALFAVAPCFYLFSRALLKPGHQAASPLPWALHALPLLAALWLPPAWALSLAFVLGAGYLVWLARALLELREQRSTFRWEIGLLGTAVAIAALVNLLALMPALVPREFFFALYACAIGLALLLVQLSLNLRPQLPAEVRETARAAYGTSTLAKVDCAAALADLARLVHTERLYSDADLSLATLAGRLNLSPHQLSELMNVHLGKGFSRYLREQRVDAARRMLLDEPSASVLSVGLSVGFGTQSNFYEAFREIEGMTPGQYRKLRARAQA